MRAAAFTWSAFQPELKPCCLGSVYFVVKNRMVPGNTVTENIPLLVQSITFLSWRNDADAEGVQLHVLLGLVVVAMVTTAEAEKEEVLVPGRCCMVSWALLIYLLVQCCYTEVN